MKLKELMHGDSFDLQYKFLGKIAAYGVFLLGCLYAVITLLGFFSLESPQDPIGDPYFLIMEVLIIMMAPLMLISMAALHFFVLPAVKIYSLTSLLWMTLMAGTTTVVHGMILMLGRDVTGFPSSFLVFSFKWPSVVYALDILAWDWFFALSLFFAAPVFRGGRQEKRLRFLMIGCALLSLMGLAGVLLANMQIRNVGIMGYGVLGPIVFLLLAMLLGQDPKGVKDNKNNVPEGPKSLI